MTLTPGQFAGTQREIGRGLARLPLPLAAGAWGGLATRVLPVIAGAGPRAFIGVDEPPQMELVYRNTLAANADLVAGSYAHGALPSGVLAGAVTTQMAFRFGLHPGSRVVLAIPAGQVAVAITAIVRIRGPRSSFWAKDSTVGVPSPATGRDTCKCWVGRSSRTRASLSPCRKRSDPRPSTCSGCTRWPSAAQRGPGGTLLGNLNRAGTTPVGLTGAFAPAVSTTAVTTALVPVLAAFLDTQAALQAVLLLFVSLIVTGAAVIRLAAGLIAVRRAGELGLLRSRGASVRQVAAPLIAAWQHRRPGSASASSSRTFPGRRQRARSRGAGLRRLVGEVTAVAACVAGLVVLHHQGIPAGGGVNGVNGVNWYLAATPVLVAVPVVVIVLLPAFALVLALSLAAPGTVPVLASPAAAASLGGTTAQLTSTAAIGPVRVRVAGTVTSIPGQPAGSAFLVMVIRRLPGPLGMPAVNKILVTGSGISTAAMTAVVTRQLPGASTAFRSAALAALARSPLQHGAGLILPLAIATAAGFGLFILMLGVVLGTADRTLMLTRLTVMGHQRATGPALDLSVFTGPGVPVTVRPDWVSVGLPAAAAWPGCCGSSERPVSRRRPPPGYRCSGCRRGGEPAGPEAR